MDFSFSVFSPRIFIPRAGSVPNARNHGFHGLTHQVPAFREPIRRTFPASCNALSRRAIVAELTPKGSTQSNRRMSRSRCRKIMPHIIPKSRSGLPTRKTFSFGVSPIRRRQVNGSCDPAPECACCAVSGFVYSDAGKWRGALRPATPSLRDLPSESLARFCGASRLTAPLSSNPSAALCARIGFLRWGRCPHTPRSGVWGGAPF